MTTYDRCKELLAKAEQAANQKRKRRFQYWRKLLLILIK